LLTSDLIQLKQAQEDSARMEERRNHSNKVGGPKIRCWGSKKKKKNKDKVNLLEHIINLLEKRLRELSSSLDDRRSSFTSSWSDRISYIMDSESCNRMTSISSQSSTGRGLQESLWMVNTAIIEKTSLEFELGEEEGNESDNQEANNRPSSSRRHSDLSFSSWACWNSFFEEDIYVCSTVPQSTLVKGAVQKKEEKSILNKAATIFFVCEDVNESEDLNGMNRIHEQLSRGNTLTPMRLNRSN
jgi:hypothetical protein